MKRLYQGYFAAGELMQIFKPRMGTRLCRGFGAAGGWDIVQEKRIENGCFS
jgi:hypothetical protein